MKSKLNKKAISVLWFVLPYIFVEFTNVILSVTDKSISNSIGTTTIIVFSSLISLESAINIIQECISQSHSIVLARSNKDSCSINDTAIVYNLLLAFLYL